MSPVLISWKTAAGRRPLAKNMTHMGIKVSICTKSCSETSPVANRIFGSPNVSPVTSKTCSKENPAEITVTHR